MGAPVTFQKGDTTYTLRVVWQEEEGLAQWLYYRRDRAINYAALQVLSQTVLQPLQSYLSEAAASAASYLGFALPTGAVASTALTAATFANALTVIQIFAGASVYYVLREGAIYLFSSNDHQVFLERHSLLLTKQKQEREELIHELGRANVQSIEMVGGLVSMITSPNEGESQRLTTKCNALIQRHQREILEAARLSGTKVTEEALRIRVN